MFDIQNREFLAAPGRSDIRPARALRWTPLKSAGRPNRFPSRLVHDARFNGPDGRPVYTAGVGGTFPSWPLKIAARAHTGRRKKIVGL